MRAFGGKDEGQEAIAMNDTLLEKEQYLELKRRVEDRPEWRDGLPKIWCRPMAGL